MPIRTVVTLAIAVLLGLIAVFLVRNYLSSARGPTQQAQALVTTPVVVAATQIERGKIVEAPALKVVNYPNDAVPAGAFRTVADLTGTTADKRVAMRAIAANEPILADSISGPGGRLVLSATLTPGMRAVSLRSNDVAGVAGFVLPGDRVDILLTRAIDNRRVTQILAENIRVVGIDQTNDQAADKPQVARAVTVETTPDQAQMITIAQSVGEVSLTLRHPSDQLPLLRKATTVTDLGIFGGGAGRPAVTHAIQRRRVAPRPQLQEIHVTRGLESADYRIVN